MKNKFISLILILILTSCSSFVRKLHSNIENKDNRSNSIKQSNDPFELYRKRNLITQKKYNIVSNKNQNELLPSVKRKYESIEVKKRKSDYDVFEGTKDGSLWTGSGQNNYFFARNNEKNIGDIVIIQVEENLKNMITQELQRNIDAFKARRKKAQAKKGEKDQKDPKNNEANVNQNANTPKLGGKEKIFDNISSVVIEKINNEHYILRGKKEVLFKNVKHIIEVQGLIPKKFIATEDKVLSSNLIEKYVRLIK